MNVRAVATWAALAGAGALAAAALARIAIPAPWLIGPLVVAITASAGGFVELRVPHLAFSAAQAAIGILIAQAFTPPVIASIARSWTVMLLVICTTLLAAAVAAWLLARFSSLSPPTAAWGSTPGGAAAMTAMSGEYGADQRIVALMQYLRVTIVVLSASVISRLLLPGGPPPSALASSAPNPLALAETLFVTVAGAWTALRLRLPGGALLGPMILGAALHGTGMVRIAIPPWLLDAAYVAIGLGIGLLYTRATLAYALRVLPTLILSTLVLVLLCCGSAALLVATIHVDALTAYLATTPGGLDSVTVIALASGANVPLVLALQALRLFVVILSGPPLARLIARIA